MSKLDVYIVIVTYNGMKWINQCLSSCKGYKVIVVDNASTDNTVSYIQQYFPDVIVFSQKKNLGFGGGNNLGIGYAYKNNAKYVFLLNQDAYLQENTLKNLIKASQDNPEYGILSPIHLNGTADKLDKNFSDNLTYDKNNKFYFDAVNNSLSGVYRVPFVNAAAWLLPRKTIEIVGGFDPIFFHYGEDDNYCQRVNYHDSKIGVVPNAYVLHDREGRVNKKASLEESLKLRERKLKYKWANINVKTDVLIKDYKSKLKQKILLSVLKLKFSTTRFLISEYKLINKILPEIKKSREINSKSGANYV